MNLFKRKLEANKVRETLSVNKLPVDEDIFCSALSNGRAEKFEKLSDEEMKDLKRLLAGFTHQQLLDGVYSIAHELKVISSKEASEANDEKIVQYLTGFEVINKKNEFRLKNLKGDIITFNTPFTTQSYYAVSLIAKLLGDVYLMRSSVVN